MNIWTGYIVVRVKQVLLTNVTMMKLDKKTTLTKRCKVKLKNWELLK